MEIGIEIYSQTFNMLSNPVKSSIYLSALNLYLNARKTKVICRALHLEYIHFFRLKTCVFQ